MTGSHSNGRTSWGYTAGLLFLPFLNAAGLTSGIQERASGTVAAPTVRRGRPLCKSISAHTSGGGVKLHAH